MDKELDVIDFQKSLATEIRFLTEGVTDLISKFYNGDEDQIMKVIEINGFLQFDFQEIMKQMSKNDERIPTDLESQLYWKLILGTVSTMKSISAFQDKNYLGCIPYLSAGNICLGSALQVVGLINAEINYEKKLDDINRKAAKTHNERDGYFRDLLDLLIEKRPDGGWSNFTYAFESLKDEIFKIAENHKKTNVVNGKKEKLSIKKLAQNFRNKRNDPGFKAITDKILITKEPRAPKVLLKDTPFQPNINIWHNLSM